MKINNQKIIERRRLDCKSESTVRKGESNLIAIKERSVNIRGEYEFNRVGANDRSPLH